MATAQSEGNGMGGMSSGEPRRPHMTGGLSRRRPRHRAGAGEAPLARLRRTWEPPGRVPDTSAGPGPDDALEAALHYLREWSEGDQARPPTLGRAAGPGPARQRGDRDPEPAAAPSAGGSPLHDVSTKALVIAAAGLAVLGLAAHRVSAAAEEAPDPVVISEPATGVPDVTPSP
jgi:hypothetical protein